MKLDQIRTKFIAYFKKHGHTVVPASSLVPKNDPTLLFTNAGMVQFKEYFTGEKTPEFTCATSSQVCIRAGGKHNDLENVGHTARHHTFFEMLGNFSFGDYFKKEAIHHAWQFLTKDLKLDKKNLYVSVHKADKEAFEIWKNDIKIDPKRIYKMSDKDNFWAMADTGPCGPCSEVYYDQGLKACSCGKKCEPGADCDRYMEIWNLVFMQFNRDTQGKLTPLPKPCVDTGAGLERLASVLQGVKSNYDIDLFKNLISDIEKLVSKKYGKLEDYDTAFRVIADHIRAITFLISEGVLPSNEGRGYVLRRILRRAIRYGKKLDMDKPFLFKLVASVERLMGEAYPQLIKQKPFVEKVIFSEEERFLQTLDKGLGLLEKEIEVLKQSKKKQVSGEIAYKLYDTFGFPLDLIHVIARENHLTVDEKDFQVHMEEQRKRARSSWVGSGEKKQNPVYQKLYEKHQTKFLGYETTQAEGKLVAIMIDGELENSISVKKEEIACELVFTHTPFYGEGGGQIGDTGTLQNKNATVQVKDTKKPFPYLIIHQAILKEGSLKVGELFTLSVDAKRRHDIMLNHTATHMLHHALQAQIGDHIRQAGSLVAPDRLRFDFTHFSPLTSMEIEGLEKFMNERIRAQDPVTATVMSYKEAIDLGAMALFGEKYEDNVRVLQIGNYSTELCGGTHLHDTGEIRLFKIISETAIAAGVRRIEALTGDGAFSYLKSRDETLKEIEEELKASSQNVFERVKQTTQKVKELERGQEKFLDQSIAGQSKALLSKTETIHGIQVIAQKINVPNSKALRTLSDQLKNELKSGIIILGADLEGRASLTVAVTQDLVSKYSANDLIQKLGTILGGKGGGRNDFAQGGGPDARKLSDVFRKVKELL